MRRWFYIQDGERVGPIEEEEFFKMCESGAIAPETMVWTKELEEWTEAERIEGLIPDDLQPPPMPSKKKSVPPTAKTEGAERSPQKKEKKYKPGGFLLFFCVSLTILSPIAYLLEIVRVRMLFSAGGLSDDDQAALGFWMLLDTGLVIYAFIVGLKLWQGHRNGPALALDFLWTSLLISLLAAFLGGGFPVFIRGTGYFIIWCCYFVSSKRVKRTYPDPTKESFFCRMWDKRI